MVFYNKSALDDIEQIFIGLLEWHTKDNKQLGEDIFINKIINNYLTFI